MEIVYTQETSYNYGIKTTEDHVVSHEFYGDPSNLPVRMRAYGRYRGLEYHEFETLSKLRGRRYAERIRNYLNSDPKYKDEIAFNKKIDKILKKIKGTKFSSLIESYEYFYHPRFMRFVQEKSGGSYFKTSTLTEYLLHILITIFQEQKKRKMTKIELDNLKDILEVKSKSFFGRKAELVEAKVIAYRYFNNKQNERLLVLEQASTYLQKFNATIHIPIENQFKILGNVMDRYRILDNGPIARGEILAFITLLETWQSQFFPSFRLVGNLFGLDDEETVRLTRKFYRIRVNYPELSTLYRNVTTVNDIEKIIESPLQEMVLVSANEGSDIMITSTPEVVTSEEIEKKTQMSKQDDESEQSPIPTELIDEGSIEFKSELPSPSQGFIFLVTQWVLNKNAVILADSFTWENFEKSLSVYEKRILKDARTEVDSRDRPTIILKQDMNLETKQPVLRFASVNLNYETLTIQNFGQYIPLNKGVWIEQQANYLLKFAREILKTDRIISVSKILKSDSMLWVAWTIFGPRLLGKSGLEPPGSKGGRVNLYLGDHGARILAAKEHIEENIDNLPIYWFGSYHSLYSYHLSMGTPASEIRMRIRAGNVRFVPKEYYSSIDHLSLFLKYQMPKLPEGTSLIFPELAELFLKYYISDDLKEKTANDIFKEVYNQRFTEFEEDFVSKYGIDYRSRRLKEVVDDLGYTPSLIEKARLLEEVEDEVDQRWKLELRTFEMDVWTEATKIYQNIQNGNYHAVQSEFEPKALGRIKTLMDIIHDVARSSGYKMSLYLRTYWTPEFLEDESKLKIRGVNDHTYHGEMNKLALELSEHCREMDGWRTHITRYQSREIYDYTEKDGHWEQVTRRLSS